jgi:NTP pyrophosphatase (non-canonical NTP hydrolase)
MNRTQKIEKIFEIARHKHKLDIQRKDSQRLDPYYYLKEIALEVDEVLEELSHNNIAHLEDELGDIFWGLMIAIEKLTSRGYIEGFDRILDRVIKKYEERIYPLKGDDEDYEIWNNVKKQQKLELQKEKERRTAKIE